MAVRREGSVPLEHARRREDLDVPADVRRALDHVGGRLSEGAEQRERGLAWVSHRRGRGEDVDLEHGVRHLCARQLPAALGAHPAHVREEVSVRVLGHPVRLEHRMTQAVEIGHGRFRRSDATAPVVDVPASPHGPNSTTARRP